MTHTIRTVGPVAVALLAAGVGFACAAARSSQGDTATAPAAGPLLDRARQLTRQAIVVDTHIDVPYRLLETPEEIAGPTGGDFDHPRAVEGGLDTAFMSIYVPASLQATGGAFEHAEKLIDMVEGFVEQWPEKFALVTSPEEARRVARREGVVGLALGMENGAPIRDLDDLRHFQQRGIRYVTLTHSEDNQISDSSFADMRTWGGLSPFGREVVLEMNRLGVMVDVSHLSDEAFRDVLEVSRAPVIASHSSCRHFTPGFERNMSDEMIRALAEAGGVIQINFGSAFLTPEANQVLRDYFAERTKFIEETGLDPDSPEVDAWEERFREEREVPLADVGVVADHIEHVIELVGVDHVGLGSDFDGVGDTLPVGLEDVSKYPNLTAELLRRGYEEPEIRQILGENLLRVWAQVELAAER